jgi:hypothetical protein
MKYLIFTAVIAFCLFIASCSESKKETLPPHMKSPYRVLVYGKGDTTISSTMFARTETVGLVIAEDDKLKAVLKSYHKLPTGEGVYEVEVTSKLNCQSIIRWGWEQLSIDNITPSSDVIPANQTRIFTLTGDAKVGKIKLKAESDCGNSSTLIINITIAVLPVVIINNVAEYDKVLDRIIVFFTIDDPTQAEWIIIQNMVNEKWNQVMLIGGDNVTKSYRIPLK